jgi:hypothetical protein
MIENKNGSQTCTTIDYVFASKGIAPRIRRLTLEEDRMGSDHKMLVIEVSGRVGLDEGKGVREAWRVEDIPEEGQDKRKFVHAFQSAMHAWIQETTTQTELLEAMGVEAHRVVNIMEWSFQARLDKVSDRELGVKRIGPRASPRLDAAMRMMNDHRRACEMVLKRVMADGNSTDGDRAGAVGMYRDAKRNLLRATAKRKEVVEGELFRQIEEKQADSKLFWSRAKKVTGGMNGGVSPPPMAMNEDGVVETDPMQVLEVWKIFSEGIASQVEEEEGIYDDEHRDWVEKRLKWMRELKLFQGGLDDDITKQEVFAAIRKLKLGKAPGIDGVLTSILKTAADAVGTNKLKEGNTVVEALTLMFNYVFLSGQWPERWGSGIIFPLYKEGSRMEPGNYRPITLR